MSVIARAYASMASQRGDPNVIKARDTVRNNFRAMSEQKQIEFIKHMARVAWSVAADPNDIDRVYEETKAKSAYKDKKPLTRLAQAKDIWKEHARVISKDIPSSYISWGTYVVGLQEEMAELLEYYSASLFYDFNGALKYGKLPYKIATKDVSEAVLYAHQKVWEKMNPVFEECKAEGMTWKDTENPYDDAPFTIPKKVVEKYSEDVRKTSESAVATKIKEAETLEDKMRVIDGLTVAEAIQIATIVPPSNFLHYKEATLKGKKVTADISKPVIKTYSAFTNKVGDHFGEGLCALEVGMSTKMELNFSFSVVVSHMHWFFDEFRRSCNGGGQQLNGKEPREFEMINEVIQVRTKKLTPVQEAQYKKMMERRKGFGRPMKSSTSQQATSSKRAGKKAIDWGSLTADEWTPELKKQYLEDKLGKKVQSVDVPNKGRMGYINESGKHVAYDDEMIWDKE
jgi:hypothetical protein